MKNFLLITIFALVVIAITALNSVGDESVTIHYKKSDNVTILKKDKNVTVSIKKAMYGGRSIAPFNEGFYRAELNRIVKLEKNNKNIDIKDITLTVNYFAPAENALCLPGCITLIGWLFLPVHTHRVDYDITVGFQYRLEEKLKYETLSLVCNDEKKATIWSVEQNIKTTAMDNWNKIKDDLDMNLKKYQSKKREIREDSIDNWIIAVMPFRNTSSDTAIDTFKESIASNIYSKLISIPNITLIERQRIQAIIDELKFSKEDFIDKTEMSQIGNLLGSSHLIIGEIVVFENTVKISARLISAATGKIAFTVDSKGKRKNIFTLEENIAQQILDKVSEIERSHKP